MFFWNSPAFSMIQQMLAIWFLVIPPLRLPSWLSGKESAWNAGNARNIGSFPGSGRPPAEGHVNPLWYSCLENPMDRETWRATVHGVAKNRNDWATDTFSSPFKGDLILTWLSLQRLYFQIIPLPCSQVPSGSEFWKDAMRNSVSEQPGNTEPLYPSRVKLGMLTAPSNHQERLSFPEAGAPLLEHHHGARRCPLALCGARSLGNWPTTMPTLGSCCWREP